MVKLVKGRVDTGRVEISNVLSTRFGNSKINREKLVLIKDIGM